MSTHPLPDGMPNPSLSELETIERNAHGALPNAPPPAGVSEGGITNLKLNAFKKLFEAAFFDQLITNISDKVWGSRFSIEDYYDYVLKGLKVILAQEELHALDANNALAHVGVCPIEPCQYKFPVHSFDEAILLATTFTNVLGTLQDAVERFAISGDFGLSRVISSFTGQEGEQLGWFRVMQSKFPSELPSLATSDLNFAFTAIQNFVMPGTCPNINTIPLKTFPTLDVTKGPTAETGRIKVSFK